MKTIKKLFAAGGILFLLLIVGSCNKFEDLNTNPDTTVQANAAMLCTNVILSVTKFSGKDAKAKISDNALPKYVGYANEGQLASQYNLIGGSSFDAMTVLPNIDRMLEYANGVVMENSYKGVAKFARAIMFYKLTMEMGDIPYSETDLGHEGLYKPKYDTQESVLIGILDDLKAADQFFADGVTFTGDPTPYNGDPAKWRKAVNAFSLRILMSLSKKEAVTSLNLKSRFAEIVAAGNLMDASTGYYGLKYSSTNKHPFSGTSDLFTSRTLLSSLLVDNLKALNDYRLYYFGEPSAAKISEGLLMSDPDAYVGVDVAMNYSEMNAGHNAGVYSLLNKRYLTEDATEPLRMMTYAEQELILAEAVIANWITGNAQTYYEEGVKAALADVMPVTASFAHGNVITSNYIANYFVGEAAFKANTADQLKQIRMQRYILNFMQEAETSYFEYRRTTYPEFPINPATSLNTENVNAIPMRWTYPGSESSVNRENLINALNSQYDGYDEINKLMWVLK